MFVQCSVNSAAHILLFLVLATDCLRQSVSCVHHCTVTLLLAALCDSSSSHT